MGAERKVDRGKEADSMGSNFPLGYMGKVLRVDLTTEKTTQESVDEKALRQYLCGTGIGMCIAANKVHGIRAALCYDELNARISRHHNNANVLCLSGDLLGTQALRKIVEVWLTTEFSGGRHKRRVNKIKAIEEGLDPRTIKGGQQ